MQIFNLIWSCVLCACICTFLCKLRTCPLKHPLLLQKAHCFKKTILTQNTAYREDGIPLKLKADYGAHEWKNSKTYSEIYKHTWLHQSPQIPVQLQVSLISLAFITQSYARPVARIPHTYKEKTPNTVSGEGPTIKQKRCPLGNNKGTVSVIVCGCITDECADFDSPAHIS